MKTVGMSEKQSPWGAHSFGTERRITLPLGRIAIRCLRRGSDLLVRETRIQGPGEAPVDNIDESTARRYAFDQPVETVEAHPRTPSRPLLVRPRQSLVLGPGARVLFFVTIPIEVQLDATIGTKKHRIERLPSEILSDTWFGDTVEGVLCFGLKSRARRDREELGSREASRCICTLDIVNESQDPLRCEKFCLRLEHCKLWTDPTGLWTSPVRIRYRGTGQLSAIDYDSGPPEASSNARLVAEAETPPPQRGLLRRTFAYTGLASLGL